MGEEVQNFFKIWLIVLASLCYTYFVTSKLPKGKFRVISLVPIFSLFIILPLSLTRPIPTTIISWFITWLANFKLLLYCFDLGPLPAQNSLILFILFAAFPILPKQNDPPTRPEKVLNQNIWVKTTLFLIFVYGYDRTKSWVIFGIALYLFIDTCFIISTLFMALFNLELEEPSDEPYASSSLQDFWGKRWNRMVSYTLRETIYFPVRSVSINYVDRKWAQTMGTLACFIVSGLMHELMYYHVTRARPTWEVTLYFTIQGLCVVLEVAVKRELGWYWKVHWAISGFLTVAFVKIVAYWLFFEPLRRNQFDVRAVEDVKEFGKFSIGIFV